VDHQDAFSTTVRRVYTNDLMLRYRVTPSALTGVTFEIRYQGCNERTCFLPQNRTVRLGGGASTEPEPEAAARPERSEGVFPIQRPGPAAAPVSPTDWAALNGGFRVAARTFGYMREGAFVEFLDRATTRQGAMSAASERGGAGTGLGAFADDPVAFLRRVGMGWTLLLIILGGLLLNLTPCVLPMIPVNLAILGAGTQRQTRWLGLAMGGCYGLGIAAVYGALGLVVVLTGAQFGALNSSPWFNLAVALLFAVLALAMFGVITIDLSRFQAGPAPGALRGRGRFVAAAMMGGVAALLAGACVAPVVIGVLVLAGSLYAQGVVVALALPFLLGVGMALPWPFAGAGLTLLPKPGAWMVWVKNVFGVFLVAVALYYSAVAYRGWSGARAHAVLPRGVYAVTAADPMTWRAALDEAERSGKPVFVDFWATWCKNCEAMDATTFRNDGVRRRLAGFVVVKFQTEDPADPATRAALEFFGIKGLPTYLVLKPGPKD
jgi:thiol:disulfide interchange protein